MGTALLDARVDLNPHQIEAALFASQATSTEGRLLADEVGLGKTIEAALVLTQRWAERRRRLLVIVPASLRRQWATELEEKFGLPTRVLEGSQWSPTEHGGDAVTIASYHFAARQHEALATMQWDLVVFDEAHRLRTFARTSTNMASRLVSALRDVPKLLLTATPLQNSLLELHALIAICNEDILGDESAFRATYRRGRVDFDDLRERIGRVCHRTLRRDVLPYIRYTRRHALTWSYQSSDDEKLLYEAVSNFIARDTLVSVPRRVQGLIRVLLRKLLASSTAAVAGALEKLRKRAARLVESPTVELAALEVAEEFASEGYEPEWEDWADDTAEHAPMPPAPRDTAADECAELERLIALATKIPGDTRATKLVEALKSAFARLREAGAAEKAVVFTESLRTQARLFELLSSAGFEGRVVCFSGNNNGPMTNAILARWAERHPGLASGRQRAVNIRAAIIDHFQEEASILLATEAGSEGLNLQFCSLVVNYDLPWNPQRIEQRIGRCHRYGQRHDVLVLNFVDETNQAERRVLELLSSKIGIFEGTLGASDAILGALESGIDVERRIHAILDECRSPEAIEAAFAALRTEMDDVIRRREAKAHKALFEHFDDAVHERLRLRLADARARLDRLALQFWSLVHHGLSHRAHFHEQYPEFRLDTPISDIAPGGRYVLVGFERTDDDAYSIRASHPLGELVIEAANSGALPDAAIAFDITRHSVRVSAVERLRGQSGWLACERLRIDGLNREEHIVLAGYVDGGRELDREDLEAMFGVPSRSDPADDTDGRPARLEEVTGHARELRIREAGNRNQAEVLAHQERLERWAADRVRAVEFELDEIRKEHAVLTKRTRTAPTLEEARALQTALKELDTKKRAAREAVFRVEDEVEERRNRFIAELDRRARQQTTIEPIFSVRWTVV